MLIGIGSWTFPWSIGVPGYPPPPVPLTPHDLIDRARALDVRVVQFADNMPLHTLSPAGLEKLRSKACTEGIVIEVGTRGVEPAWLFRYLGVARCVDARLLRTITHTTTSQPDLEQVEYWLRDVLPEFESSGVSIALETYEKHTAREIAELIERIGSPFLGVCLDTINSLGILETPAQVLDTLAAYVINVHAKDFVIRRSDTMMGYDVRGCPAGEGQMAIETTLAKIGRFGRSPNVILEQWPPFTLSVPQTISVENCWAEQGVRYLKSLQ